MAEYGYLDVKQLCSNQELMRDLREFGDLDHELRTRTLAFVKKSKSDEEKELLKQAVLAAKLPIDLNSEALKFHLSVAQRVQAVEIKITTNHVPSLGGSASTAKAVVHAKRFGLKTGSGDKHDGSASPSKFAF